MAWSDNDLERVKRMWLEEGKSATDIARALGNKSRNAVLSKINREGWLRKHQDDDGAKFDRLVDIVADADLNKPVSVHMAARLVGLSTEEADRRWAALYEQHAEPDAPRDYVERRTA